MASIRWAHLCELAFLDNCGRLCVIGVTTQMAVPSLPLAVRQLMIAAHVVDVRPGDEVSFGVSIATPMGISMAPDHADGLDVAVAGDYLLITMRDIPLTEEGVYHVLLTVGASAAMVLDVPVLLTSQRVHADVH